MLTQFGLTKNPRRVYKKVICYGHGLIGVTPFSLNYLQHLAIVHNVFVVSIFIVIL